MPADFSALNTSINHKAVEAPVIFLPGTLCDERIWLPIWQQMNLNQRSYVPLQWAESLDHMMALSQDRIDQANGKVHLVGFSMGGYIASLAALKNTARVASLTCIGYNPNGLDDKETKARMQMLKLLKNKQGKGLSKSRLMQYFTAEELKDESLIQVILDMESDLGNAALIAHISSTTPRKSLVNDLAKLKVSQHWIAAQHDLIADSKAIKDFCDANKQAQFFELTDTAHISPLTKSAEISHLLHSLIK